MDTLTPHDGITNEKIAKAQIEAVEQKQNEYKLIGQMVKVSGHTLFKFNTTTREAGKAVTEEKFIAAVNPKTGQLETRTTHSVNVEKDCYYEQALNMPNFIKRLRRRGIIGSEEIVIVEK
ncbi:MAG: hypothetical protein NC226_09600 [Bacteroides cellulosilyticus]|nr:hypothetical protein [Bacteroides cellulosilyticus]